MICLVLAIPFTALTVAQLYDGSLLGAWLFAAITVVLLLAALFQGVGQSKVRYDQQRRDAEDQRLQRLVRKQDDDLVRGWQAAHRCAARTPRQIPNARRLK